VRSAAISAPAVHTTGLGKRYGSHWALQDCSLDIPQGRVSALVGPNGAGKTTLLKLLAGLARATEGEATVLGRRPGQSVDYLASIGYLAQEMPLYRQLSGEEHVRLGADLNRVWDAGGALERLAAARVPMCRPVRTLSGGQRAQIALAMALAKQPQLLLLDEPVAALDPLARRQFLASLASAVADGDLTVVLSSHLLHDLERVCDHVVVLTQAHSQLCADIDQVLAHHRVAVGPRQDNLTLPVGTEVIRATHTARQSRLLVRLERPVLDPSWTVEEVGLEDIVIGYMGQQDGAFAGPLSLVEAGK
jgi:ABC-2 type transport system ATP-binding protein